MPGARLLDATARLREQPRFARLPVSYLAGGTTVGAVVWAATELVVRVNHVTGSPSPGSRL
ncbi:MAG TPA: hypothetical protein VFU73_07305 [Actinocrinis sp.]|nr:hypothetical protein [Actinocrinis sp.]